MVVNTRVRQSVVHDTKGPMVPENPELLAQDRQAFARELETYGEHHASLVKSSEGKIVLIEGSRVVDVFESKRDALAKGYELFGNGPFLAHLVTPVEEPIDIYCAG